MKFTVMTGKVGNNSLTNMLLGIDISFSCGGPFLKFPDKPKMAYPPMIPGNP